MCTKAETKEAVREGIEDTLEQYMQENDNKHKVLLDAIKNNEERIKRIDSNTAGMVNLYQDALATGRIGRKIGAFIIWLGSFSFIAAIFHWFTKH